MENLQKNIMDIDELDIMLIRELEKNARTSFLALSSKLGTSQPTVQRRFNRLVDLGIITISTVPAYAALGYKTVLILAIHAPLGILSTLNRQLATISNIKYLWNTAGHYNIMAVAFYRNPKEYLTSFQEGFGDISENVKIETILPIKLIKRGVSDLTLESAASSPKVVITELDVSVIRELEKYPRIPVKELAHKIGVSLPPVRSSLRKLTSRGIIRVVANHDPVSLGYNVIGSVLIQAHPSSLKTLTDKLKVYPCVIGMSLTIGAFNCVIFTSFKNLDKMSDFLAHDLGSMPGVVHYESLVHLSFGKKSFDLVDKEPNGVGYSKLGDN